jgi:hypothetical protein
MSLNNSIKPAEKFEIFKKLSQQFMILSQEIEGIDGDIPKDKADLLMLKYDNLIQDCLFEEIPQKYKMMVANKYAEANRYVPIQINGTIGNVVKRVNEDERINNIV